MEGGRIAPAAFDSFPHLVFSTYGTEIDADLTDRLIAQGVEMFLDHYTPRDPDTAP
ncbi:hypothetical protein [Streptomyces sp. NPDC048825]|uniref:hypothetical protein n=1 Tax=Streptomyces sp. NPDC048825 TaxID=3365592 RepID=UPI00371D49C4